MDTQVVETAQRKPKSIPRNLGHKALSRGRLGGLGALKSLDSGKIPCAGGPCYATT